jgi:CHASE3 domain sensor protein
VARDSIDAPLARKLFVAIVTPLGLLLAFGIVLTLQIGRMTDTARAVDHTDEVIGRINELQKQIIDQETGATDRGLRRDRWAPPGPRAAGTPL